MVDVLLILPPPGRPYLEDFKSFAPPLGLAYLASALRQAGFSALILDYYSKPFDRNEFDRLLVSVQPKAVGMSAYTENFSSALMLAARIKRYNDHIKIILGGPHVTHASLSELPPDVDAIIRGEGEVALVSLLTKQETDRRPIPGVIYRDGGGQTVSGPQNSLILDPQSLPVPERDLLDPGAYVVKSSMLTSRGCGQSCIFCVSWHGNGKKVRLLPDDQVLSEIAQLLSDPTVEHIHFWDETFTADRARTIRICKRFRDELRGFSWSAGTRVDMVDPDLLGIMRRAGCIALNFGVESGNPDVLRAIGKKISIEQVEASVTMSVSHHIVTTYNFMMPAPEDTVETVRGSLKFALQLLDLGAGGVSFNISTPFPGTLLYEQSERLGIKLHDVPWDDYHYWNPVFSTRYLDRDTIRELYYEVMSELLKRRR